MNKNYDPQATALAEVPVNSKHQWPALWMSHFEYFNLIKPPNDCNLSQNQVEKSFFQISPVNL